MRKRLFPLAFVLVSAALAVHLHAADQNLLANPGFNGSDDQPAGWRLLDGGGSWEKGGRSGEGRISVEGNGRNSSAWREVVPSTRPGSVYRLRFWGRREAGATGGTTMSGPSRVNRDFELGETWREFSYVFRTPDDAVDFVRFGQWEIKGRVSFDDVSLVPSVPVHAVFPHPHGLILGEGETIQGSVYRFRPDFGWRGANVHRPLVSFTCGFNSGRWLFPGGGELIFRFEVEATTHNTGEVSLGIQNYAAGALVVEAGSDGKAWLPLGQLDGKKPADTFQIPKEVLPARQVWVRLRQAEKNGYLQMAAFRYEAELGASVGEAIGATHFVEVLKADPNLVVAPVRLQVPDETGRCRLDLRAASPAAAGRSLWVSWASADRRGSPVRLALGPGGYGAVSLEVPMPEPGAHRQRIRIVDGRAVLYEAEVEFQSGFLAQASYGSRLGGVAGLDLWWCESGWKVGRERTLPKDRAVRPVALSAARGEFEAVQVVLRPSRPMELKGVTVRQDERRGSEPIEVRVDEVAYVYVSQPTDWTCQRGWYPDPLPPLATPLRLVPGLNQPLWITFRVPAGAKAGQHRGELLFDTSLGEIRVPWQLRVFDFQLPGDTHLRSAFGMGAGSINAYHGLERAEPAKRREVLERYLRNFAEHRISPYSFSAYDPIGVKFVGEGAAKRAVLDFTGFDAAAAKWIDGARFNTFSLPLHGMGGGTFQSRSLGHLEGFEEGTPEHARLFQDYLSQVEAHLREKGWLDEAFTYWFDEPDPKDYEFVVAGMRRIKAAAPGLRRMLTEQPEPALIGNVDIWCGLTPEWTPERVRTRREAGEEVWWYICTGPKAPYVTEFIDHPGTELRLWPWQSWQYGINGILIWETLYWSSPVAFPPPKRQDPWLDPMSYVSGYDFSPGTIGLWGNGDGRFLYPPRSVPEGNGANAVAGPINSLRWENLRDGMEDYEYLWLLREEILRLEAPGRRTAKPNLVKEARLLLTVPPALSKDLTNFTTDPRIILTRRDAIARMIERLQILSQP